MTWPPHSRSFWLTFWENRFNIFDWEWVSKIGLHAHLWPNRVFLILMCMFCMCLCHLMFLQNHFTPSRFVVNFSWMKKDMPHYKDEIKKIRVWSWNLFCSENNWSDVKVWHSAGNYDEQCVFTCRDDSAVGLLPRDWEVGSSSPSWISHIKSKTVT
jgi:hypothetical protein